MTHIQIHTHTQTQVRALVPTTNPCVPASLCVYEFYSEIFNVFYHTTRAGGLFMVPIGVRVTCRGEVTVIPVRMLHYITLDNRFVHGQNDI